MTEEGPSRRGAVSGRTEAVLYVLAACLYIGAGFTIDKGVFAWWPYSTAWFITFVWVVPAVIRALSGQLGRPGRSSGGGRE